MANANQFKLSEKENEFISFLVVSGQTNLLAEANKRLTIINSSPPQHPLGDDHSSPRYQWIKKTVVPARKKSFASFCDVGTRTEWPTKHKLKPGYTPGNWLHGDRSIIRTLTNQEYKQQSIAGSSTTTTPPSPTTNMKNNNDKKVGFDGLEDMNAALERAAMLGDEGNIGMDQEGTYYAKCSMIEWLTGTKKVTEKELAFLRQNAKPISYGMNSSFFGLACVKLDKVKDNSMQLDLQAIDFTVAI